MERGGVIDQTPLIGITESLLPRVKKGVNENPFCRGGGVKNIHFFLGFFWQFGRFSLIWRKG